MSNTKRDIIALVTPQVGQGIWKKYKIGHVILNNLNRKTNRHITAKNRICLYIIFFIYFKAKA